MKANSENMPVNTVNEKQLKDVKIICFPLFNYSNGSSSLSFQSMKVKTMTFFTLGVLADKPSKKVHSGPFI